MSCVFFFKQKTAYDMRISDWSSDVCSSDLRLAGRFCRPLHRGSFSSFAALAGAEGVRAARARMASAAPSFMSDLRLAVVVEGAACGSRLSATGTIGLPAVHRSRSEEHTSELQSLMRISYAVFCSKKKK